MRTGIIGLLLSAAAVLACPALSAAVEVKLTVDEKANVARSAGLVTVGVPFARGQVRDVGRLAVSVAGRTVPAQFARTVAWDDGSVRWALLDVQADVPVGGKVELVVSDAGGNPAPSTPVKVEQTADAVRLSTGPLQVDIGRAKFNLLQSVRLDGRELVTSGGRGLVVYKAGGGEVAAGPPTEVTVEHSGPIRAVVCLRGRFPGIHNSLLSYTVRVTALAGQRSVKVHAWLENDGAVGYRAGGDKEPERPVEWFVFDGMAVELGLGLGDRITAACEGVSAEGSLKVLQTCRQTRSTERNPRPPFFTLDDFEYTITSKTAVPDAEGQTGPLKSGLRTDGVVSLRGGAGSLTAAIRDFWQNYEKAIELDGTTLKLWLWPTEGQWPRKHERISHSSLYDKTLQGLAKPGLYYLPGSVHKGHEFVLDFSGRDPAEASAELSAPLTALASAEHYASSGAAPGLFAPPQARTGDSEGDFKLASWVRMARSAADPDSPSGLYAARKDSWYSQVGYFGDSAYWFGWLDYGDLQVPGRGPVSLHYDWPWIMLVNAMRTGEANFLHLATDMARHRVDVDQHWSDRDPEHVRGLQRNDSNYPAFHSNRMTRLPSVSSNWLEGVVLYYMMTGEPKALEAARRNGDGLIAAWQWIAKAKPYGGPQGDMAANAWSINSFCALFDLTADRKWLDQALELFNTNVKAKWDAHGPFLHDPARQIQSQDYIKDDMKYCYAIRALCLLHHYTGDETVFMLLTEGCEKEMPETFFEAPLFVSDKYAYVAWKTGDRDLLDKAVEMFIQGFPESKSPPVWLPDNSTWSRQSAMMLRAGHLLQFAAWKMNAGR